MREARSFEFHCFIHSICYIGSAAMLDNLCKGGLYIVLSFRVRFTFCNALQVGGCFVLVFDTLVEHALYSYSHGFKGFRVHTSEGFFEFHLGNLMHGPIDSFDLHLSPHKLRHYCLFDDSLVSSQDLVQFLREVTT